MFRKLQKIWPIITKLYINERQHNILILVFFSYYILELFAQEKKVHLLRTYGLKVAFFTELFQIL